MGPGAAYAQHRLEIFRLFITEDRTLRDTKLEFERRGLLPASRLTDNQWRDVVHGLRIYKTILGKEAFAVYRDLAQTPGHWTCLVFAGDVLLCNYKIARHYEGKLEPAQGYYPVLTDRRTISMFRNFRHLLYTTRVHFESSFDSGIWAPDHQGLYARSPELRSQLYQLSRLHNVIADAIRQFKAGDHERGLAQLQIASQLYGPVVRSRHHRQFPDLLAILLMIWRSGGQKLQRWMLEGLSCQAANTLSPNDPRRIMLSCLRQFDLDQICHLYLSFDAYCRHLWMTRVTHDELKAYYSYNQASFPRADVGTFYSLFDGMSLEGIQTILAKVDKEFGKYSAETFCLWHTAIQYLWNERKYVEMGFVSSVLGRRVDPEDRVQYIGRELNRDAAMTFYLRGQAEEALGYPCTARCTFALSMKLRDQVVPSHEWDATRAIALNKLVSLDTIQGNLKAMNDTKAIIERMYTRV